MAPSPPPQRKVMLLSPDPGQQRFVTALVARGGWRTLVAPDADRAQAMLGTQDGLTLDAVIVDDALVPAPPAEASAMIGLPSIAPDDLVASAVRGLRAWRPALPIIILDGAADAAALGPQLGDPAMAAVAAGADDVLPRPITADRILTALDRLVDPAAPRHELRPFSHKFAAPLAFDALVGSSPLFRNALAIAAKAARGRVPVLIEGAAGVGKDAFARAIHAASPRSRGPLLSLDCASVAPGLLASQLFGHERGAFPGAFDRHVGQLARADGGTLVIDRIECLPLDTQGRLVEWLRTGIVQPLGGQARPVVDVRIIATTGTTLLAAIQSGLFREDLYYGLTTTQVAIPSLNERRGDIPALARHFLDRLSLHPAMPSRGIDDAAIRLLGRHRWPGNVRQLQDALIRAAIASEDHTLTVADFPGVELAVRQDEGQVAPAVPPPPSDAGGVTLYLADGNLRPLEDIESDVIRLAICHYRGRMTEVARRLGIGRSTLYRKLGDLGIDTAA